MLSASVRALLLFVVVLGVACSSDDAEDPTPESPTFDDGTLVFSQPTGDTLHTIDIAIADSDPERQRGLMRQRSLGYDRGMLFIFDEVDDSGMWMKNTPLSLDIIFVAPDSQVINIARRTTPFSQENIDPDAPKKFVVEVRAGFADRFGITDTTRVRWTRIDE